MSGNLTANVRDKTASDALIDGLLAGIGAGAAMVLLLLLTGLLGGGEAASIGIILSRFDPLGAGNPMTGLFTHIAVSAIYGLLFGLILLILARLWAPVRRLGWLVGLVYGLVLYGIARGAFSAGVDSGLAQFPTTILLSAHVLYGLVLGLLTGRKW